MFIKQKLAKASVKQTLTTGSLRGRDAGDRESPKEHMHQLDAWWGQRSQASGLPPSPSHGREENLYIVVHAHVFCNPAPQGKCSL